MRMTLPLMSSALAAAALCTCTAVCAAGKVEVKYVEPENFADVGFGVYARENTLKNMTAVLQELGALLPDGQTLQLEVSNINLAGRIKFLSRGDVRVMSGRDWPEVTLHYTLLAGGTTLKSGDARIYDVAYPLNSPLGIDTRGPLAYEKYMLKRWFDNNFAAH